MSDEIIPFVKDSTDVVNGGTMDFKQFGNGWLVEARYLIAQQAGTPVLYQAWRLQKPQAVDIGTFQSEQDAKYKCLCDASSVDDPTAGTGFSGGWAVEMTCV